MRDDESEAVIVVFWIFIRFYFSSFLFVFSYFSTSVFHNYQSCINVPAVIRDAEVRHLQVMDGSRFAIHDRL